MRLAGGKRLEVNTYEMARQSREAETKDSETEVELKMVRFARHGTNEVCGVKCKSSVFYGTKLSNPQSSSIGEMYRGNKLEGISLPQAASRFSSRNLQIEKNQFQMLNFNYIIFNMTAGSKNY